MKFPVYIVLLLLVLSPVFVYAESQTISVETGSSSYEKGSIINISGLITDYDESDPLHVFEVTVRIVDPKSNIVSVDQMSPNSGGTFSTSANTDGSNWKFSGDYTVMVNYGAIAATTTFTFAIPEVDAAAEAEAVAAAEAEAVAAAEAEAVAAAEAEAVAAAAAEKCGEGTHLEDGVCVLDEPVSVEITSSPSTSSAETVSSWVYSITFAVLIAFIIAIFLYLISRASRRKTA